MKAIMISDHAKWCALMMNGDKTVEVRTNKALYKAIQKLIDEYGYADIYVYCSKERDLLYKCINGGYDCDNWKVLENRDSDANILNSKVIFKFRCYKVEEIEIVYNQENEFGGYSESYGTKTLSTNELLNKSQLDYFELAKYLKDYTSFGCAIHINDLEIFDKPKKLSEFRKPRYCDCKLRCNNNLEHSFCREVCSHNLDSERLGVCCDRDGWVKEWNTGNMNLTKAPQSWCYVEVE